MPVHAPETSVSTSLPHAKAPSRGARFQHKGRFIVDEKKHKISSRGVPMAPSSSQLGPALPKVGKFFHLAAPIEEGEENRLAVPKGFGAAVATDDSRFHQPAFLQSTEPLRNKKQWFPQIKKSERQLDVISKLARQSVRAWIRAGRAGFQQKMADKKKRQDAARERRAKRAIAEEQRRVAEAAQLGMMEEKQKQLFAARMERMRAQEEARREVQELGALAFMGVPSPVRARSPTAVRFFHPASQAPAQVPLPPRQHLIPAPSLDISRIKDARSWQEEATVNKAEIVNTKKPKDSAITRMMKEMIGLELEPESDEEDGDDMLSPLNSPKKKKKKEKKGRKSMRRRRRSTKGGRKSMRSRSPSKSRSPGGRRSTIRSPGGRKGVAESLSPSVSPNRGRKSIRNSILKNTSGSPSANPPKVPLTSDMTSADSSADGKVSSPKKRKMSRRMSRRMSYMVDDIVID